jgi:hypothetical protein
MALLKINTTELPVPTVLQPGIQDLDSEEGTGRNQAGDMFRDRVTVKRKVHCEWGPVTKNEMRNLLSAMSEVSFSFTYPDPQEGAIKTITAYVGDRSTPMLMPLGNDDWMWGGLSADFIEL